MSHGRNGHRPVPTGQPIRHDSSARFPGQSSGSRSQPPPAFASPSPWSRSVSTPLQDLQDAHPRPFGSNRCPAPAHHTRQIPIHESNSLPPRQANQQPRQAFIVQPPAIIPHPATPERTSRQATQDSEDEVLKKLRKVIYIPNPKNQVKSPSLRSREQNRGGRDHTNTQNLEDEDGKSCPVCLEDFEPRETVMVTPCKHMFHEECIVPWLKCKGRCPVCRTVICEPKGIASPVVDSDEHSGFMAANDLFAMELLSIVRAIEDSIVFGYPRRRF